MKYLLIALFVFAAVTLHAQELSTPINISNQAGTERPPIMHVGPDGIIYITWIRSTLKGGDIYLAYSTDNGHTFTAPKPVTDSSAITPDFQRGGEFAIDTKNTIHVVWVERRNSEQQDVWYSRSSNKGESWTEPVAISDDELYNQDYISIACDSSDRIYVSFLDERDQKIGFSNAKQLYFTMSADGGATWSANKKISKFPNSMAGTCDCCKQDIVASPEGHVYAAFRSNIDNQRDMFVVRSYDAGKTFEPPILIQTSSWIISACPVSGPNAALDKSENLHVVWRDNRQSVNAPRTYYAKLEKDSSNIPENLVLSSDALQPNWPDVSAYGNGANVAVTFETFDKGMQYEIISSSLPGIMNIDLGVSETKRSLTQIAFGPDGSRYMAWTDDVNDNGDIFFARDTAPLPSLDVKRDHNSGTLDIPSVVTAGQKIVLSSEDKLISIVLSDISGREVAQYTGSSFIVPNVAAAVYLIKITTDKQIKTGKILVTK